MDVEDLSAIRQDIDKIDQELVRLLCQRMDCSRRVAETKPVILVTHDRTELNLLRANIVNL